jgi:hypothetical protein
MTDYLPSNLARNLAEALRPAFLMLTFLSIPIVVMALALVPFFVWPMIVPKHAANFRFHELSTTLTLKYYMVWDEAENSGRYLTIETPYGRITENICGFDWAHWSRVNIYLTRDRRIGVSAPGDCGYVASTNPVEVTPINKIPFDEWAYVGAFALTRSGFRFVPASEQMECRSPLRCVSSPDS